MFSRLGRITRFYESIIKLYFLQIKKKERKIFPLTKTEKLPSFMLLCQAIKINLPSTSSIKEFKFL